MQARGISVKTVQSCGLNESHNIDMKCVTSICCRLFQRHLLDLQHRRPMVFRTAGNPPSKVGKHADTVETVMRYKINVSYAQGDVANSLPEGYLILTGLYIIQS